MTVYRVHVLYEQGGDSRPYTSSHIRLLRPLTHPSVQPWVQLSAGPDLAREPVDLVVVDRLWCNDLSAEKAEALVEAVGRLRARLVYSLDDNLVVLLRESKHETAQSKLTGLEVLLRAADRVVVSTWALHHALAKFNPRISVIPNYLDERLLPTGVLGTPAEHKRRLAQRRSQPQAPLTLGYMGTRTHDEDLRMIVPALWTVWSRHPGSLRIEVVGAVENDETWALLDGLPVTRLDPGLIYTEYPAFMPWFVGSCRWDIALAPLIDSTFNTCKSDIKFLDYAALGAAGIFSRVLPYERSVQHGVTGYLAENTQEAWQGALDHAITHPVEALSVGWAAQRHLMQHRTLAQGAELWLNLIRQVMTQGA